MTVRPVGEQEHPPGDRREQARAGKEATIAAISHALANLQAAYDDRDRALAQYLGVGRTDLRCLDLIVRGGPQTASELGARLHLTRGSMTTLIDRLERAGYVRRRADPGHGKRKIIVPTPKLAEAITPVVRARQAKGSDELRSLPAADLAVILSFLQTTLAGQDAVRQAYLSLAAVAQQDELPPWTALVPAIVAQYLYVSSHLAQQLYKIVS